VIQKVGVAKCFLGAWMLDTWMLGTGCWMLDAADAMAGRS